MRRSALAILLALAFPSSAPAVVGVGIADSDSATFTDPAWPGLGVRLARAVAPWDVALTDPAAGTPAGERRAEFDRWVAGAQAAGVEPLVTFERSLDPGRPGPPTLDDYAARRALAVPATRFSLGALPPDARLWIDEAGAYFRDITGAIRGDDAQRAGASRLVGLPAIGPRIARLYYYNLSDQCSSADRCA